MKRVLTAVLLIFMACLLGGCSIFYTAYDSVLSDNLTRGSIVGSVYASAYAGLVFTAPDDWTYATDTELAKLMDLGVDAMSDAGMEFSEEALEKQVLYDMQAKDPVTGTNVLLMYENLALTGSTGMSEAKYIDVVLEQLTDADIYQYEFGETTETELCGQSYQMVCVEMTDYNVAQYYYVRKVGKYMLCIIISVPAAEDASTIMDCFTAYEADSTEAP